MTSIDVKSRPHVFCFLRRHQTTLSSLTNPEKKRVLLAMITNFVSWAQKKVHSKNCWQNKQNIPRKICRYSSLHLVSDKNTDFVSVWNKLFKENTCIPEHEFMCKKLKSTRGTCFPKAVDSLIDRPDMKNVKYVSTFQTNIRACPFVHLIKVNYPIHRSRKERFSPGMKLVRNCCFCFYTFLQPLT